MKPNRKRKERIEEMEPAPKPTKDKCFVYQKEKVNFDLHLREFPWSEKQKQFLALAEDKETKVIFLKGPAGTAKTMLAVYSALKGLQDKKISPVVYIRNPVESSQHTLGFLKGGLEEKLNPYLQPLQDKLNELVPPGIVTRLTKEGYIQGMPLGFLRGLTFNVSSVIVDEAQNLTSQDLLLIMTRMGKFSKLFVCGDIMQSDIRCSHFQQVFDLFNDDDSKQNGIHTVEFGTEDIFRSDILAFIIEKFERMRTK